MRILSSGRLRNFLLWIRSKEFLIFLFFLLVSGFFWAMLAVKDVIEYEVAFPVAIIHQPKNVVINHDGNDTLRVTIRDNGYNIISYLYNTTTIEVGFVKGDDDKFTLAQSDLIKIIRGKLSKSAEIVSIKPDKLDFYYSYGDFAYKPIAINGTITAADNYFIVAREVMPDSVRVVGTPARLQKIDSIRTQYVRIRDVKDSITKRVRLQRVSGVSLDSAEVNVRAIADYVSEMHKEVDVKAINVPEGKVVRTIPGRVNVNFVAPHLWEKNIHQSDFILVVDYNDYLENPSRQTLPVYLRRKHNAARRVVPEIKEVDFKIEQQLLTAMMKGNPSGWH